MSGAVLPLRHLFVYGTLRRGETRWPHLASLLDDAPVLDHAPGRLFDTGRGYPAAIFGGADVIVGETARLRLAGLAEALDLLDAIEGAVHDLYRRVVIRTSAGTDAWAYEFVGCPDFAVIPGGDWLHRVA